MITRAILVGAACIAAGAAVPARAEDKPAQNAAAETVGVVKEEAQASSAAPAVAPAPRVERKVRVILNSPYASSAE